MKFHKKLIDKKFYWFTAIAMVLHTQSMWFHYEKNSELKKRDEIYDKNSVWVIDYLLLFCWCLCFVQTSHSKFEKKIFF